MNTIDELARLGEQQGESTVLTLSIADDARRRNAARILPLLGWKLVRPNGIYSIEPGDRPADGLRQAIPAALGIDEIAMQETLEAGRDFQFTVASEAAPLIAAGRWTEQSRISSDALADAFAKDLRLAKVYAGLAAMGEETADALLTSLGLRTLASVYPEVLASYGDAFTVSEGRAATPGGAAAEPVWLELAGANPRDPPAFFRALIQKDHGNLAAFYHALSRADGAHQRFFTQTSERAKSFYAWYRDSGEVFLGIERGGWGRRSNSWRPAFFRDLPLDEAGHVRFPGGLRAWTRTSRADAIQADAMESDAALLDLPDLDALAPVARLESERGAPLDEGSARLLVQHYAQWRHLFPYFEKLPGLGAAEFRALAAFSARAGGRSAGSAGENAGRNALMGEWHSLVKLIVLGTQAGAVDARRGARLFRHVCTDLTAADHSLTAFNALSLLREIVGGGEPLDEAIPRDLLRLTGERRAAFDRVRELLQVPPLDSTLDALSTLTALSGLVYAAVLDPDKLLVSEDPLLPAKHRFMEGAEARRPCLFCPTALVSSNAEPGSYFKGGFMTFEEAAKNLARGGKSAESPAEAELYAPAEAYAPASGDAGGAAITAGAPFIPDAVFHTTVRLVEVYATVTDEHGRYIDDLEANQFTILESGKPLPAAAFEARSSSLSVALLFDTTGSMLDALPALKNAALKLIGDLRPIDWVKVYAFGDSVTELLPFTTDKAAARRAVLRTRAAGTTALYDALVRVNRDLTARSGKKVIVVFTDGADNASALTMQSAIRRAHRAGIPIYTIAQGEALQSQSLLKQLAAVSRATGGVAFAIHTPAEISQVFESVSQDLTHGYLLAFRPPPDSTRPVSQGHVAWRPIEVVLREPKGRRVRAREGYFPD